jgi:ribosome-associated protein
LKTPEAKPSAAAAETRELLKRCCAGLLEKKAEEVYVLNVSAQSSITDYLVIATGTSEPHRRALRIELERILDETHTHVVGVETTEESGWTVVDAFDLMIHIFSPEQRARYRLENLWRDSEEVPLERLLGKTKSPKGKAKPGKKSAKRKPKAKSG